MENPQRLHVQPRLERLDAHWVVGFVDGEGCFFVGINPHPDMTSQFQVLPEFTVVQHERDVQLLHALKAFFGCGVVRRNHAERMAFRVRRVEHLNDNVIPFFEKHPLKSKKHLDFLKFRDVLRLMQEGAHLTPDGIAKIRVIASRMNRGQGR
jgi:LAGLIDADG endonuclease